MKPIFCLVGPSASGKTTVWQLMNEMQDNREKKFETIVSHTTRKIREGEVHGKDYYYVSEKKFEKLDKVEEVSYSGNRYCIAAEEIKNKLEFNCDFLVVIVDYYGYQQIRDKYDDVYLVYFDVPKKIISRRLIKRDGIIQGLKRFYNAFKDSEFNREGSDLVVKTAKHTPKESAIKLYREIENLLILFDDFLAQIKEDELNEQTSTRIER